MKRMPILGNALISMVLIAGTLTQALAAATATDLKMNLIANESFAILAEVPVLGLETSAPKIENIIRTQHQLASEEDPSLRHMSLVVADAIAFSLMNELHRSEIARLHPGQESKPKSVPFNKETLIRLWKFNMPDFKSMIPATMKRNDRITSYVINRSTEEELVTGEAIDKAPIAIRRYIRELRAKSLSPLSKKQPTPDESLIYVLTKWQVFRDLGIVVDLYAKGDLPETLELLRSAVDQQMRARKYSEKRMDDGLNNSAFKIVLTYQHYYPDSPGNARFGPNEEYICRQAFLLSPFMTDTTALPDIAREGLRKAKR